MRLKLVCAFISLCFLTTVTPAQTVTFTGPKTIVVSFTPQKPTPPSVIAELSNINNYAFYDTVDLTQVPASLLQISQLDDATKLARLAVLNQQLQHANLIAPVAPVLSRLYSVVTLQLKQPYVYGKHYVLSVAGVDLSVDPPALATTPTEVPATLKPEAEIQPSIDANKQRSEIRVHSDSIPFSANSATLSVESQRLKLDVTGALVKPVTTSLHSSIRYSPPGTLTNNLTLALKGKLAEDRTHSLMINQGLVDSAGQSITASGRLEIAGLAAPNDDPTIDIRLLSNAAVHQKPDFDLSVNYAPNPFPLSKTSPWSWGPTVIADVGLGQTKASNSISLNFHFSRYLNFCREAPTYNSQTAQQIVAGQAVDGYCQLNSRRNKNRHSDKMNRRWSSGQLTIASMQTASSHTANLDFITAR